MCQLVNANESLGGGPLVTTGVGKANATALPNFDNALRNGLQRRRAKPGLSNVLPYDL